MSNINDGNPQAGQGRPLPKKEGDLFKTVLKYYEGKLYKKGIKAADQILRKFPNHGETLAMKGLTLNCMGKGEEAHELVKRGLTNDMRSHVCWHVYGLLHRSDGNYNEAIKAYKQALRIDPENIQILRDLSLLQIQMRDLHGFTVTRNTILTQKPNNKIHWLAFALAKHISGDLDGAVSVIDAYLGTLDENSTEKKRGFESSELALYRNMVLTEMPGDDGGSSYEASLEYLEECKGVVVDETAWLYAKARNQLLLGRYDDARRTYVESFVRGSTEDYKMHSGYMCSLLQFDEDACKYALSLKGTDVVSTTMKLTSEQKRILLEAYTVDLPKLIPKSHAVRRIPLTLLNGAELRDAVDEYCRRDLSKGVPYLGKDLGALLVAGGATAAMAKDTTVEKAVTNGAVANGVATSATNSSSSHSSSTMVRLKDPVDIKIHPVMTVLVELVDGYIQSLESTRKFPGRDDGPEETPSTLLWSLYLRAHLHEMCGEYADGLALVEKCIEHTPTAVDMYEKKARLLKLCGDVGSGADCLDKAREMDLQDRYINNKTTKYMLRADREVEALERISLFTKHDGNAEQNLFDMQCSWYELELAECFARKGMWGPCLKKFVAVVKHFEDFHADQFDFHSYCIRKVTLRAYVDVLRFEDNLWGHKIYCRAADGIIKSYIHLHDNPADANTTPEEPDYSSMTPAERKKAKAIARKKKKAAEKKQQAASAAAQNKAGGGGGGGNKKGGEKGGDNGQQKKQQKKGGGAGGGGGKTEVVDEDPNGEKLLKKDALDEANKFSSTLVKSAPQRLSTWTLRFDVAMRRGKKAMALQALFKAKGIDADSSEVFKRIVEFSTKWLTDGNSNAAVSDVISEELKSLLGGVSIGDYVASAVARARGDALCSLPMRIAVAEALVSTKTSSVPDAASVIIDGGVSCRMVNVQTCQDAFLALEKLGDEAASAKADWVSAVTKKFPLLKNFG